MAHLRHTARKSVISFLPSRLVERPLHRPVTGQSSHLERLHHRLHEEQERRRQEQEQQCSSFLLQQEIESMRSCSRVLPLEVPPAPPLSSPWSSCWRRPRRLRWRQQLEPRHRPFRRPGAGRMGCLTSLATLLAGVTSTTRSTPCYARHSTGVLGPSSIVVLSSSTVTGFTRTAGRRPAWCAV